MFSFKPFGSKIPVHTEIENLIKTKNILGALEKISALDTSGDQGKSQGRYFKQILGENLSRSVYAIPVVSAYHNSLCSQAKTAVVKDFREFCSGERSGYFEKAPDVQFTSKVTQLSSVPRASCKPAPLLGNEVGSTNQWEAILHSSSSLNANQYQMLFDEVSLNHKMDLGVATANLLRHAQNNPDPRASSHMKKIAQSVYEDGILTPHGNEQLKEQLSYDVRSQATTRTRAAIETPKTTEVSVHSLANSDGVRIRDFANAQGEPVRTGFLPVQGTHARPISAPNPSPPALSR